MSRLIDVAAVLDRMAKALAGTEQGEACAFAVRLMRERESAAPAKHPDTERGVKHARKLNGLAAWLEHEADVRNACATNEGDRWDAMRMSECAEAIREYAARKQEASK